MLDFVQQTGSLRILWGYVVLDRCWVRVRFCWLSTPYYTKGASTLFASKSYIWDSCLVISITEWWFVFTPFSITSAIFEIYFLILYHTFLIFIKKIWYNYECVVFLLFSSSALSSLFPTHSRVKMTKTRQRFVLF